MATLTLGTDATNTLTAVNFTKTLLPADVATINRGIRADKIGVAGSHPIISGDSFSVQGLLYVPNRGLLQILPGDYIGIDADGWPILVSASSIGFGSSSWTHS